MNIFSLFLHDQILKYVEEDIVLSLNTRWLCLSSASAIWEPAFTELSLPELILRKLLQVMLNVEELHGAGNKS